MLEEPVLRTERLLLRPFRDDDRAVFAQLNADPRVMEFFPSTLTAAELDALADRIVALFDEQGWGLWAVEVVGSAPFVGFVGLNKVDAVLGYPSVEIGWRLIQPAWGHGYATEGATAALRFGFEDLALDEIVAMAAVGNARSRRVMTKLGMTYRADEDFDHPRVPAGSPLRRHALYRIGRAVFAQRSGAPGEFDLANRST